MQFKRFVTESDKTTPMLAKLSPPARLGIYYFIFGVTWILVSGKIAEWLANDDTKTLKNIESYKGLAFILISSFFILFGGPCYL